MKIKVIGTGAAGNKGAIRAIELGVIAESDVLLINSTKRDIPAKYQENAYIFETDGGCGKETSLAASLTLAAINDGGLDEVIENFIDEDTEAVMIVSSGEGGTGCGSAPILGEFIDNPEGINLPVIFFLFGGFLDDGRGLQNTIEYFQKMNENYMVQAISNRKFLSGTDRAKAESDANNEFATRLSVMLGNGITDSGQNMDETDLYKSNTQPGFMTVCKAKLDIIKNTQQLDDIITETIDNDPSFNYEKGMRRLGVIINMNPESQKYIDRSYSIIKEKIGTPYEQFEHIQYDEEQDEYIAFICSGILMPKKEIEAIYKKYQEESSKVNKKQDDFFGVVGNLEGNEEDNQFNTRRRRKNTSVKKEAFISGYTKKKEEEQEVTEKSKFIKNNY